MKLIASLIVRNEVERYLPLAVASLREFCDEIRVLDDGSTDGTYECLLGWDKCFVLTNGGPTFFEHEGQARNNLLAWTLEGEPTHILAIDADEVVADGRALRAALDHDDLAPVWTLDMQEIWKADVNHLWMRMDGGWRPHPVPCLYRVTPDMGGIEDKQLSCGREPLSVRKQWSRAYKTGTEILHLGWLREEERQIRYDRYVEHDGGKFHASQHLQSIMYPDRKVRLKPRLWPTSLLPLREELAEKSVTL